MRKIIFLPVLMPGMMLLFLSCMKERGPGNRSVTLPDEIVQVKISTDQSYQLDLIADTEVSIAKQASHYLISETRLHVDKGSPVYFYQPKNGFSGTDEVKLLSVTKISGNDNGYGGCNNGEKTISKYTIIKITVGQ